MYQSLPRRADALMDLIDALSANTTARTVIELSLSPIQEVDIKTPELAGNR